MERGRTSLRDMVDPTWLEIQHNQAMLEASLNTLRENGEASAAAYREYHIAKTKAILTLREKGYPTTLIPELVKGVKDVADLKFKSDVADVVFQANKEAINVYKKKADDLRVIYEREYSNTK